MAILVLGLNHNTAPVEIREKLAMSKYQIGQCSEELKSLEGINGLVVLSTCNRTEVYCSAEATLRAKKTLLQFLARFSGLSELRFCGHIYVKENKEAVRHLFRVAAGLDSMILGESQILGQVETAYNLARDYKISNPLLNGLFQKAISVGKRVRTETKIDRQAVSVGSAAVELARQHLGDLQGRQVLVLGAGETSELTVRHLVSGGVSTVIVANRTFEKARNLAREVGGTAVQLDRFPEFLAQADIVISCTASPKYLLGVKNIAPVLSQRGGRPLLLIDIAVPRDIDPAVAELAQVILYDMDGLQEFVRQNLGQRRKEGCKAELLVNEELNEFMKWLETLVVVPVISALKKKADVIKEREFAKSLPKLGALSEKDKNTVHALVNLVVNKLLNDPIMNLKEYVHTGQGEIYAEALRNLFALEDGAEGKDEEVMIKP